MTDSAAKRPLFVQHPELARKLPWMPLANLPTPVEPMKNLGNAIGHDGLYIKRDDLSSSLYGGNKPRKLEFLLADAKRLGRKQILTYGGAGSNHGVAVALHASAAGFSTLLYLSDQPVMNYVRKNLLVNLSRQAKLFYSPNEVVSVARSLAPYFQARATNQPPPYMMWFGGSTPLGTTGFVNAAYELAQQVEAGELPMPKQVFVATGSCGTHAGLLVGFAALGLPIQVVGVRIVPRIVTNPFIVAWHANRCSAYLHSLDSSFPKLHFSSKEINLIEDYFGGQYGRPTGKGLSAIKQVEAEQGIHLDPTYTGKALAAFLDRAKATDSNKEPILFWNTYNSVDLSKYTIGQNIDSLPKELARYFTDTPLHPEL